MRRAKILALGLACGLSGLAPVAAPLAAQGVVGRVFLPDGATPAAGIVLVLVDRRDSVVARSLSGNAGQFRLTATQGGSYRVRAMRVGYRVTESEAYDLSAGAVDTLPLVLGGEAVRLAAHRVAETDVCRGFTASGDAVAAAWDEARKALEASNLAATDEAPLQAEWVQYDRVLAPAGQGVRSQLIRTTRAPTHRAFRSAAADRLAREGYVIEDRSGLEFFAPDADVLLSESFAATHCFRIAQSPDHAPGQFGIAFRPTAARGKQVDIEGTFWLDGASAELRALDFRYLGLPEQADPAEPGGRVEFLRLANGRWLISRWMIRMPIFAAAPARVLRSTPRGLVPALVPVLKELQVTGGEVLRVESDGRTLHEAPRSRLSVVVRREATDVPVAGVRVALLGTDHEAHTDDTGLARLDVALPGRYELLVADREMQWHEVAPVATTVEIGPASDATASVRLPPQFDLVETVCGRRGGGLLYGIARDSSGAPMRRAAVSLSRVVALARDSESPAWFTESVGILTADDGSWRLCGVPVDAPLLVRVQTDDGFGASEARVPAQHPLVEVPLTWLAADATGDRGPARGAASGSAFVDIYVTDEARVPIGDAMIEIAGVRPPANRVRTDAGGRALLPGMAAGNIGVRVRRVGYVEGRLSVSIEAGRNTLPIILDRVRAPVLDTVRVVGDGRVRSRHEAFERRLRTGAATASFTEGEIRRRNPVSAWQMLSAVASVSLLNGPDGVVPFSRRVLNASLNDPNQPPCYMRVAIDGLLLSEVPVNLAQVMPPPQELHGIEVFAGPASVPVEYGGYRTNMMCGLIAIWTK